MIHHKTVHIFNMCFIQIQKKLSCILIGKTFTSNLWNSSLNRNVLLYKKHYLNHFAKLRTVGSLHHMGIIILIKRTFLSLHKFLLSKSQHPYTPFWINFNALRAIKKQAHSVWQTTNFQQRSEYKRQNNPIVCRHKSKGHEHVIICISCHPWFENIGSHINMEKQFRNSVHG